MRINRFCDTDKQKIRTCVFFIFSFLNGLNTNLAEDIDVLTLLFTRPNTKYKIQSTKYKPGRENRCLDPPVYSTS